MKFDNQDFKHLQWALVFLAACLLISGAAIGVTLTLKKQAEQAYGAAVAAEKEIETKISLARSEEQELRDKIARFQALKSRGIIGAEQRLDWIETISRLKTARRIFQLDYEFAPQRPVDGAILPSGAAAGGLEIMASQMRLHMQLLHEGDLLGFLDDLRASVPALIQVRACTIERGVRNPAERGASPQLTAECTLEWITLREGA